MGDDGRNSTGFPFYYGLVIDKLVAAVQIVFWWLITVPLIIWAFVRTALLYLLLFAVLAVPIVLTVLFGAFLFLLALYWTPSISIALTTLAPLIAAGVEIGVFVLNVAWFILIVLVDLWNILIPLFVLVFIYAIHFILTVITLIAKQLSSTELTALFNELIEVGFFFADLITIAFTVIVSVLPAALSITITVARPILLLMFQAMVFLLPALQFVLLTLFQLLPAVFHSVLKLVRVFRNLLRAVPVLGALAGMAVPASESPRYRQGTDEFFNTLVQEAEGKDWEAALDQMGQVLHGQTLMPDYSHLPDPFDTSSEKRRRRADGSALPVSRGSLHARWRGNSTGTLHTRMLHDDETFYSRGERAHIMSTALIEGMHSVMDTAAPLHTHREMMTRAMDKAAEHFGGHKSAMHALDEYNARFGHPALLLAHLVPDIHGSWLGRIVRDSNPDDPFNAGQTHHEWRRAGYPPVEGHPNAEHINREIERHQPRVLAYNRKRAREVEDRKLQTVVVQPVDTGLPQGDVPLPFEMPVVLGTDCFHSKPKFILCLPRPKNRRFKAPDILIPSNLAQSCPGFIAPPDPAKGLTAVLRGMFNPITAIRNTWTYFRYILSAFSNIFYSFNQQTVSNPWLSWFFQLFALNDISNDPLTTEDLFCLVPNAWWPYYLFTATIAVIGLILPLIWLVFSLIVYLLLPFRKTWAIVSGLLLYYNVTAERVEVLDPQEADAVARQKWWRDKAVLREGRGNAELEPGANATDVVGEYERYRSRTFTEEQVSSDIDKEQERISTELDRMSVEQMHRLYTIRRDGAKVRRARETAAAQVRVLVDQLHVMGALSPHIRTTGHARMHMSRVMQGHPLASHTSTLAYARDRLTNMEVALGHRPLDEAVPLTDWN